MRDEERGRRVQGAVREAGLAGVLCSTPQDVLLATGYWPVMATSVALCTAEGGIGAVVPMDELELAEATSGAVLVGYEPQTLENLTTPGEVLGKPMRELGERLGFDWARKGAEAGAALVENGGAISYLSQHRLAGQMEALVGQAWPGLRLVAADGVLERLRAVKTDLEMEQIAQAARLAGAGFAEAARAVRVGRREDEVAAEVSAAFSPGSRRDFERGEGYFFCMSGPNAAKAAGAYARTRTRVIEEGDWVMIHANTVGDGYWTDITRTYVAGEPSAEQKRMQTAVAEAREAALEAVKPGARASAVDGAAREVLRRAGYGDGFKHAVGHGVGFAAADAQARPRLHPESPDVLEAGMVFNIEPAIYVDGVGGLRHCDVVACTDWGALVLTGF